MARRMSIVLVPTFMTEKMVVLEEFANILRRISDYELLGKPGNFRLKLQPDTKSKDFAAGRVAKDALRQNRKQTPRLQGDGASVFLY
ncbi:MAG: hypothetical protein CO113_14570 [Elusimicrobia bacterium CG_4_9_14_3_um_filter_62_55]|nr:MAG: hypothetical protein COR54_08165 [Elusimicrobia bacterium CG22_combo_CG10-13_8_21_14_all_63_91]PJA13855.1 MAG: hypothetical protein COX66_14050 [Elusimicrobia bacterium CG_4_10_14_0_2_um_filter_63_34]PJB24280.1 MAG: hypothetical protein CO113_14570 [Elusimicrobia bacterium CG_4_9_14_3_um_filter_62_55]